jgi:hypothetical protein
MAMPIEIRELIIKTEIKNKPTRQSVNPDSQEIKVLKQQIIDECLRLIKNKNQRSSFNR